MKFSRLSFHLWLKKQVAPIMIAVLVFSFMAPGFARAGVVTFPEDVTLAVPLSSGGTVNLTIPAGDTADEIRVDTDTVRISSSTGETIRLRSTNKYQLNNNAGLSLECTDSYTQLTLTGWNPITITVTDTAGSCTVPIGGGGPSAGASAGGGGGSSVAGSVSATPSTTTEIFHSPIKLPQSALLVRPTLLENLAHGASMLLPKDTVVKKPDGQLYSMGTVGLPTIVGNNKFLQDAQLPAGLKLLRALSIPTDDNIELTFTKPVTIKVPMPAGVNAKEIGTKIYWFDDVLKKFTLANGGGVPTDDGKFVNVTVNRLTVLGAAIEGDLPFEIPTVETVLSTFDDMDGHWAEAYVNKLAAAGVVKGRAPGKYVPEGLLTRAELLKIALLTFGFGIDEGDVPTFSDVEPNAWYAPYVATAEAEGIVKGRADGTFAPNDPVTRAETMKILVGASGEDYEGAEAGPFTDVKSTDWFAPYVNFGYQNSIVKGKSATKFAPNDSVRRDEMAKMAVLLFEFSGGTFPEVAAPEPKPATGFDLIPKKTVQGPVNEFTVPSDGVFTNDVLLVNDATGVRMSVTKDVTATSGFGSTVKAGIFGFTSQAPAPPATLQIHKVVQFPITPSTSAVKFDKPVWFTIPIPEGLDPKHVYVYMWHKETGYTKFGDGGQLSADGKSFAVLDDHIPYLVIAKDLSEK